MITELQGFKGSTRKYTAPVSESVFSGDQLQFYSNVSGSLKDGRQDKMPFTMNMKSGRATGEQHVVHYKDTKRFTQMRKMELRYNDIETNASTYQTFNLALSVGFRATVMGTRVKVNGVTQINKSPWTNTSGVDYYFSNNYRKINIRKPHAPSGVAYGVTLIDGDVIQIEHQTEIT